MEKKIKDTFPAKHLKQPDVYGQLNSFFEYPLKRRYGLKLKRRRKRRRPTIL